MTIRPFGTQKEVPVTTLPSISKGVQPILHYNMEYDSSHPEETIRNFVASVKGMVAKYNTNASRITEIESELVDLYHYIEIASNQKVTDGYKLYRRITDLRRERRACKNENDLLKPIYDYFHATDVLPKLTNVQGEVAKMKNAIDMRVYSVRTAVLDEFMNKEPKESKEEEEIA